MKKYETCEHAEGSWKRIVWVKGTCPKAHTVFGHLASTKVRCENCEHYRKAKWVFR